MFTPILVQDFLTDSAKKIPQKTALIFENERWTYAALDEHTNHFAQSLIEFGFARQDRALIFLDNCPEIIISLYGILKATGIFVILNGSLKAKKLAYIINDSGARVLITHSNKATVVEEAVRQSARNIATVWIGDVDKIPHTLTANATSWNDIFSEQSHRYRPDRANSPSLDIDLAALIYTSGSTGEPKGVMSTHANIIAAARSIIQYLENDERDIILNVLPLSFDYGLYQVLMAFMYGGTVVLERSFQYLHSVLKRIHAEHITGFPIVPTIMTMLFRLQHLADYQLNNLRYISNTGAALPAEHIRKFRTLFPNVKIFSMFGLTECKRVSYLPPDELDRRPTSVGKAIPNCEVFLLDEQGKVVAPGEIGELVVRGANVMQGYWNAPEITAKYFRSGRYPGETLLYSGDLFRRDEQGFLYFVSRKDDIIKCKGERISPREIENVIHEIPHVLEVAVIGVPDEISGQAIHAFITIEDNFIVTENDVLKYCKENLESFALPQSIKFLPQLPKTANGKIDKAALKNSL